jgi:hypothetical protein
MMKEHRNQRNPMAARQFHNPFCICCIKIATMNKNQEKQFGLKSKHSNNPPTASAKRPSKQKKAGAMKFHHMLPHHWKPKATSNNPKLASAGYST